ncbi:MAG: hypothetical protein JWR19_160 [Pedosphaera sp.]|jgi:hypothetical protein|nr:hypothetical protein [Pedosphaera sp.]
MKHKRFPQPETLAAAPPAPNGDANQTEHDFAPCAEEVARKAYFIYRNEGSPQGREVQHWLDAEARLLKERNQTRTHEAHHRK